MNEIEKLTTQVHQQQLRFCGRRIRSLKSAPLSRASPVQRSKACVKWKIAGLVGSKSATRDCDAQARRVAQSLVLGHVDSIIALASTESDWVHSPTTAGAHTPTWSSHHPPSCTPALPALRTQVPTRASYESEASCQHTPENCCSQQLSHFRICLVLATACSKSQQKQHRLRPSIMMHKLLSTLLLLFLAPLAVLAQNNYPIVLVHGLSGWGRDELLGLKYWGGIQGDLQEQLKNQGYTVYTAAVGPFSSNWDRACELYAQIKGGQVDYGLKHSTKHGHKRFGRNFTGMYPEWGNVANGKVNKVHLIGHSMGGQTIRMLAQLLANGTTGSPTGTEEPIPNSLFAGGKDWVRSVTTISTPNQGATLADALSVIGDTVVGLVIGGLSLLNIGGSITEVVYDTKLDQWGITPKRSTESLKAYLERVFDSKIFAPGFRDVCLWSTSVPGAKEESSWVKTLPNVYYYSYATQDTHAALDLLLRPIQVPNVLTMSPAFQVIGAFLGSRWTPDNGYGTSWQPNDGVVPVESQLRDFTGALVPFKSTSYVGKWNQMPLLDKMDHVAIVGINLHTQVKDLYFAHAKLLASLPVGGSATTTASVDLTEALVASLGVAAAISNLNTAAASVKSTSDLEKLCASPANVFAQSYCNSVLGAQKSTTRRLRG